MNFVKFRFTFNENSSLYNVENQRDTVTTLLVLLDENSSIYTWAIETQNKFGELTHPHIHIHFATEMKVPTIRKRFQRWVQTAEGQEWSGGRSGNVLYSIGEEKDVLDLKRFFRYPFKQITQIENVMTSKMIFPPNFNLTEQLMLAHEEWVRHVDINRRKRDELLNPITRDKIFEFLDNLYKDKATPTKKALLMSLMKFYADEERAANKQTIIGYCQTAMWRYGVEEFSDTADRWAREF